MPAATAGAAEDDGDYLVGHATQVLLFDRDGRAQRAYTLGPSGRAIGSPTSATWWEGTVHEVGRLLDRCGAARGCLRSRLGAGLTVSDAVAGEARSGADCAVYFRIESGSDDAIVGAVSAEADTATLHEMQEVDGVGS